MDLKNGGLEFISGNINPPSPWSTYLGLYTLKNVGQMYVTIPAPGNQAFG